MSLNWLSHFWGQVQVLAIWVVPAPKHKELIIADMRLIALLTYYFPVLF